MQIVSDFVLEHDSQMNLRSLSETIETHFGKSVDKNYVKSITLLPTLEPAADCFGFFLVFCFDYFVSTFEVIPCVQLLDPAFNLNQTWSKFHLLCG